MYVKAIAFPNRAYPGTGARRQGKRAILAGKTSRRKGEPKNGMEKAFIDRSVKGMQKGVLVRDA